MNLSQSSLTMESLCTLAKQKLSETVMSIESDEILKQMRNDKSLYEFKLNHIKELISDIFDFSSEIDTLINENESLKNQLTSLEQKIILKDK